MSNKILKVIHVADIHIRTFRMHAEYEEIFTIFINEIKEYAKGYKYDEIRIAVVGDLVHQKITISNEQLILSCWFLSELAKIGKVILIAGNHDLLENNKDRVDSLTPMIKLLNNDNISYLKESKCYPDNNIVWCNYSIFEHNTPPNIEEYKANNDSEGLTYIGLYHAPLVGATTDIGYEFKEGTELSVFEGCDAVLCGDIHKRQNFYYKNIPISFCGSLIQQHFGETVSKHGYLIWDVESRTYTEHNIATRYGFYNFKISTLNDIETNSERLLNP